MDLIVNFFSRISHLEAILLGVVVGLIAVRYFWNRW